MNQLTMKHKTGNQPGGDCGDEDGRPQRQRILILAYYFDRNETMETRLSWRRAHHAAEDYDVSVICRRADYTPHDGPPAAANPAIEVTEVGLNWVERFVQSIPGCLYLGYRLWHKRVLGIAEEMHRQQKFALVHHVSFCGYREPSDCWRIDAPFLWGPVGGTQSFPLRYAGQLRLSSALRELARNVVNAYQLRKSRRVRKAAAAASKILAANTTVSQHLAAAQREALQGQLPEVLLETGVDLIPGVEPRFRDPEQPLHILWSGRLRCWKGLPLLLKALAALPPQRRFRLRVLGEGQSERVWRKTARRLGISDSIEWIGWPAYSDQLQHYQWADVFAFTSLRDTSGTGLLEALASATPIVGLDHQGAADVMSPECAIKIPVTTPSATIRGFRDAMEQLAADEHLRHRLSVEALRRAARFSWDEQESAMRAIYPRVAQRVAAWCGATRQLPAETQAEQPTENTANRLSPIAKPAALGS